MNFQPIKRIGIARALNKSGFASRSTCEALVRDGRVTCNGSPILDPEYPTTASDKFLVDGKPLVCAEKIYLALNKPRGLVTTANDEKGRDTVYRCLDGLDIGHVGPVGRLDKASEGLLLFTNDTEWANALLDPKRGLVKRYHVKWNGTPSDLQIATMQKGIQDDGETLRAKSVHLLRTGPHSCWLEIELQEGKNREIRRMGAALGFATLRLVRVAFGSIELGDLAKGAVRRLALQEVANLLQSR